MTARLLYVLISAVFSVFASYYGAPLIHENTDANTILITMFTVFAGFLVAVMVIIGDPAMLPTGSWRSAEGARENIDKKLLRHMYLFWLYLIVIGLIFILTVTKGASSDTAVKIKGYVELLYFFMATFSFLLTMALPKMVSDVQRQRVDAVIENRRREEGLT